VRSGRCTTAQNDGMLNATTVACAIQQIATALSALEALGHFSIALDRFGADALSTARISLERWQEHLQSQLKALAPRRTGGHRARISGVPLSWNDWRSGGV
jgi:hypothetical protein